MKHLLGCFVVTCFPFGAHGWLRCLLLTCGFAAHGGFVCASDKHDVAKVEFTLAALEADAPFAKEVSVVDFGLVAVAPCVAR